MSIKITVFSANRLDAIFASRLNKTEVTTEKTAAGMKACIIMTAITAGSGLMKVKRMNVTKGTAKNFIMASERCSFLRLLILKFVKFIPSDR